MFTAFLVFLATCFYPCSSQANITCLYIVHTFKQCYFIICKTDEWWERVQAQEKHADQKGLTDQESYPQSFYRKAEMTLSVESTSLMTDHFCTKSLA